ncbi:hypothetical protein SAMD00079811_77330 (plasmid) [Scytonema sp. HK-05]|nr:hypothetical protein [Scytonema sp. HK-05]BAY50104.1 hypothetical protein SAMD00079811_77330 [Scytonema sp. HK-05]
MSQPAIIEAFVELRDPRRRAAFNSNWQYYRSNVSNPCRLYIRQ